MAAPADPGFDFESALKRLVDNFNIPLSATISVRGSRAGELIARGMVETGTNSFCSALPDATVESALNDIFRRIV